QCHGAETNAKQETIAHHSGAPNLAGFASRHWIAGLLNAKQVAGPDYFGNTKHHAGDMVKFVHDDLASWKPEDVEDVVIALSAEEHLPEQAELDQRDKQRIDHGSKLIKDESNCAMCHKFQ